MNRIVECRKWLMQYEQELFMVGMLILYGMKSAAKGVFSILWLSAIAFLFLGVKLVITTYTRKEMLWMLVIGGLTLAGFLRNHNYTLILSVFCIFAAKNVDFMKVFKWALWERVVLVAMTVFMAAVGIIENPVRVGMPKYIASTGEWLHVDLYAYGYGHPNQLYFMLFSIAVLSIIVYGGQGKWWVYVLDTIMLYVGYQVVMCRTGWYMWLVILIMVISCYFLQKNESGQILLKGFAFIPILSATALFIIMLFYMKGNALSVWVNSVMTGRLQLATGCFPGIYSCLIGAKAAAVLDLGYIVFPYNFGWILWVIVHVGYCKLLYKCVNTKQIYWLIAMLGMAIYFVMEFMVASVTSNLTLLLLAGVLFGEKELTEDKETNVL